MTMRLFHNLGRAAAVAVMCIAAPATFAAAPADSGIGTPEVRNPPKSAATMFELETEMVVHDWVLCTSQPMAEQLVRAREESVEEARSAYEDLKSARSCGQFSELRVILRERLYSTASGSDARAFGALVKFSDNWASAFVVYGSLPDN
jgi:hypothetical protein